jgi:hypothetical protein
MSLNERAELLLAPKFLHLPDSCVQLHTWSQTFLVNPRQWKGHSPVITRLIEAPEAGSVRLSFVDLADDVFSHVLQYLRTAILPVFYDQAKGHDYVLYYKILHAARHLEITRLARWIDEKKYLDAVKVHLTVEKLRDSPIYAEPDKGPWKVLSRKALNRHVGKVKLSVPAQIDIGVERHHMHPSITKADEVWIVTQREVVFDYELCLNAYVAEAEFVGRDSEDTLRN